MSYRRLNKGVLRLADNLTITRDMIEWGEYRAFIKGGGVPEPMIVPAPPEPTPAEIIAQLSHAVQSHLDHTARERNYDGILSCATYSTSTNPQFAAEGLACVGWRDAVWAACYAVMADVMAGNRPVPTESELLAELPVMAWPAQ